MPIRDTTPPETGIPATGAESSLTSNFRVADFPGRIRSRRCRSLENQWLDEDFPTSNPLHREGLAHDFRSLPPAERLPFQPVCRADSGDSRDAAGPQAMLDWLYSLALQRPSFSYMPKQRRPKPDDSFEVPGVFRMKRHGRFITIDTHRTPAQQRELMKRLSEGRPRLREEIVKFTQELTGLIHKFSSLDLLANLVVAVGLKGEQRDCEAPIEHLALLELKDREYQLRGLHMVTAQPHHLSRIGNDKRPSRLIKHARYYWLRLVESHLTRRLFRAILCRIAGLSVEV